MKIQRLTINKNSAINILLTLKPINDELDTGATPVTSTINTLAQSAYAGGEVGIDRRKRERGVTGRRDRKSANTIIADENFALAA